MWANFLNEMRVARLYGRYEARGEGRAPASWSSTLRGALGGVLAARSPETFELLCVSAVPADAASMRRYPFVPHPYVLHAQVLHTQVLHPTCGAGEDGRIEWGTAVQLEVTLFGRATDARGEVDASMEALGALGLGPDRVPFERVQVGGAIANARVVDQAKNRIQKFGYCFGVLRTHPACVASLGALARTALTHDEPHTEEEAIGAAVGESEYALRTLTPLRVVHAGAVSRALPLEALVRSLLARASALAGFYEPAAALHVDFAGVVAEARKARMVESRLAYRERQRRSTRNGSRQSLGGVEGGARWTDVAPMLRPLLAAGEVMHVGKATTFGLGRYRGVAGGAR